MVDKMYVCNNVEDCEHTKCPHYEPHVLTFIRYNPLTEGDVNCDTEDICMSVNKSIKCIEWEEEDE